jgi:hypothetical protein
VTFDVELRRDRVELVPRGLLQIDVGWPIRPIVAPTLLRLRLLGLRRSLWALIPTLRAGFLLDAA